MLRSAAAATGGAWTRHAAACTGPWAGPPAPPPRTPSGLLPPLPPGPLQATRLADAARDESNGWDAASRRSALLRAIALYSTGMWPFPAALGVEAALDSIHAAFDDYLKLSPYTAVPFEVRPPGWGRKAAGAGARGWGPGQRRKPAGAGASAAAATTARRCPRPPLALPLPSLV